MLIISGIGKIATASATGFLHGRLDAERKPQTYINIGIAGHGSLSIGTPFIANRISNEERTVTYYPPQIINSGMTSSSLLTCNKPSEDYCGDVGFDMEAHSFYEIASKRATRELIQVVKVVSDNPSSPLSKIKPKMVGELIDKTISRILDFAEKLDEMAEDITFSPEAEAIMRKIMHKTKLSQTQTHQIKRLLGHAISLKIEINKIFQLIQDSNNSKILIRGWRT